MMRALPLLFLLLAACGGSRPEPPPPDPALRNHITAGRAAQPR